MLAVVCRLKNINPVGNWPTIKINSPNKMARKIIGTLPQTRLNPFGGELTDELPISLILIKVLDFAVDHFAESGDACGHSSPLLVLCEGKWVRSPTTARTGITRFKSFVYLMSDVCRLTVCVGEEHTTRAVWQD